MTITIGARLFPLSDVNLVGGLLRPAGVQTEEQGWIGGKGVEKTERKRE